MRPPCCAETQGMQSPHIRALLTVAGEPSLWLFQPRANEWRFPDGSRSLQLQPLNHPYPFMSSYSWGPRHWRTETAVLVVPYLNFWCTESIRIIKWQLSRQVYYIAVENWTSIQILQTSRACRALPPTDTPYIFSSQGLECSLTFSPPTQLATTDSSSLFSSSITFAGHLSNHTEQGQAHHALLSHDKYLSDLWIFLLISFALDCELHKGRAHSWISSSW